MRGSNLLWVASIVLLSAAANGQVPPADNKTPEMKKSAQTVDGKTMYEWMKELKDKKETRDPGVRVRAIHAVQSYGGEAREAVRDIMRALTDSDASVRVNAAIALGLIGFDAKDLKDGVSALSRLVVKETEQQGIVRFQAAKALGRLGPDSAPAIPALVRAITDQTASEIRGAAAYALGSAGWDIQKGPDPRAIHALVGNETYRSGLHDVCQDVRMESLFSLIVLGPPVQATDKAAEKRALEALLHDKSKVVEIWGRVAIMRLDKVSSQYLIPIAKHLKDADVRVRVNAARAFAIMGQDAKSSVKDLIYALDDKEPTVIMWACIALGEMRNAAQEALPKLEGLTDHPDARVKQAAAEAISKIKAKVPSE
jgi:HEAT repeat protein